MLHGPTSLINVDNVLQSENISKLPALEISQLGSCWWRCSTEGPVGIDVYRFLGRVGGSETDNPTNAIENRVDEGGKWVFCRKFR